MKVFEYTTHVHAGDNIICTGAVANVRACFPAFRFKMPLNNPEICLYNEDYVADPMFYVPLGKITYGSLDDEQHGRWGNVVEGFTRSLCGLLGLPMVPISTRVPILHLSEYERQQAQKWRGKILLNANCQTVSRSKGYPHWQEVVDGLKDYDIVQIGGNQAKDISPDLRGVYDMRGQTSLRDLIVMVYGCDMVLSPPSCISNIAGAFLKPQIIVNASREPDILLDYPNATHISARSKCGWGVETGCIYCRIGEGTRACQDFVCGKNSRWCRCQWEIPPERIIDCVKSQI